MKTTILHAINAIIDSDLYNIDSHKSVSYKTSINNTGAGLEHFIQDALCGSFVLSEREKIALQQEYFSYIGNQNNPSDLIIRNGDALEIKKVQNSAGAIALNSSFPQRKLYRDSTMITTACKQCEVCWEEKDLCYIIGSIDAKGLIQSLWFMYGDCYFAHAEIYTRIKDTIKHGIEELGIECSKTNEIAKIKKVDPLGITDLRVRGMWAIKHPSNGLNYITEKQSTPHIKALMLKRKFDSFDDAMRNQIVKNAM